MAPLAGQIRYNTDNKYFERSTDEGANWTQLDLSGTTGIIETTRGDWTPVIGGDGGESGQSYTRQIGKYAKIPLPDGKFFVHVQAYVTLSTKGTISGSTVHIKGLPFTALNITAAYSGSSIVYFANLATNWISIGGLIVPNATFATVYGRSTAGVSSIALAPTDIANTTEFIFNWQYISEN